VARLFERTEGDLLAFLPGAPEIRRVGARLAGTLRGTVDVLPLHGTLSLEEQRRVIAPRPGSGRRRAILSTSIAETSLTVPGVRTVADSGWARVSRLHPATGLDRLLTERITTSGAEQRRGRAGRLGPGLCVRFWSPTERLVDRPEPEIRTADLTGLVLECAIWGIRDPQGLRWLNEPSPAGWRQAWEVLSMLGLVAPGAPTALGRKVATLGLAPRLGALVLAADGLGRAGIAAACAAILEERDGSRIARDPDLRLRLEMIRSGSGGTDAWHRSIGVESARILRRLGPARETGWQPSHEETVGKLLCRAFPDRLARRAPDGSYRLVTGRTARFPGLGPGTGVRAPSRAATPWIVALDADPGETTGLIRLAAPVDEAAAAEALSGAAEETLEVSWEGLVPRGALVRRAGRLVLSERRAPLEPAAIERSFTELLRTRGVEVLPWNVASRRLLSRVRFLARARPESGLGDLSDDGLAASATEWLVPMLRLSGGQVLSPGALHAAVTGLARRAGAGLLGTVPESMVLPSGRSCPIDYDSGEPVVEARIQEVFGLGESPRICGVAVTFRLLSPARRPLQITRDLASFWGTTYAEVRKEMRGRYPKHYWPDNPLEAEPTSGVRPR
jgi:ATP-dependent helicase HrpB